MGETADQTQSRKPPISIGAKSRSNSPSNGRFGDKLLSPTKAEVPSTTKARTKEPQSSDSLPPTTPEARTEYLKALGIVKVPAEAAILSFLDSVLAELVTALKHSPVSIRDNTLRALADECRR